jgi:hypothetical protein
VSKSPLRQAPKHSFTKFAIPNILTAVCNHGNSLKKQELAI